MRNLILLILTLFFLNSCSVHTFTYGDGPKQGYTKVLKQQNFLGGLISENTPSVDELNDEKVSIIGEIVEPKSDKYKKDNKKKPKLTLI